MFKCFGNIIKNGETLQFTSILVFFFKYMYIKSLNTKLLGMAIAKYRRKNVRLLNGGIESVDFLHNESSVGRVILCGIALPQPLRRYEHLIVLVHTHQVILQLHDAGHRLVNELLDIAGLQLDACPYLLEILLTGATAAEILLSSNVVATVTLTITFIITIRSAVWSIRRLVNSTIDGDGRLKSIHV